MSSFERELRERIAFSFIRARFRLGLFLVISGANVPLEARLKLEEISRAMQSVDDASTESAEAEQLATQANTLVDALIFTQCA